MADRDKLRATKSRIDATRVVSIITEFIDEEYSLVHPESTPQSATGLKKVFELTCLGQPTFVARWDQKVQEFHKDGALDIDDEASKMSFKKGEYGSSGHHTVSLGDGKYRVDLVYKCRRMFSGVVHVGIAYEGEARCDMKLNVLFNA